MALQARLVGERGEALAARITDERRRRATAARRTIPPAPPANSSRVAAEQRAQQQGRRQRPACAQRTHEFRSLAFRARRGDRTNRLIARLAGDALGPVAGQPSRRRGAEILRRRHGDLRPQARRQRRALEQRLAHLRVGAETREDAGQRACGKRDLAIADQRKKRLALADLGQRRDRARLEIRPSRQRRLGDDVPRRHAVDKVGVGQHRRAARAPRPPRPAGRAPTPGSGDAARRQRCPERRRAPGAPAAKGRRAARSSPAPPRRARLGEIGMEIGAGERACRFRALLRPGALRKSEKSAHNVRLGERRRRQKHGRRSVGVHVALPRPSWRWMLIVKIA